MDSTTINGSKAMMIRMSDYSYQLKEESIARYPANPRGSSKLLRLDGHSKVSYNEDFSKVFPCLAKGAHVVFNDSRVLDARLFVLDNAQHKKMEVMLLDLGQVDVTAPCPTTTLVAMIRTSTLNVGDTFPIVGEHDATNGTSKDDGSNDAVEQDWVEIVAVHGIWEEDEKSDGNGMECLIRIVTRDMNTSLDEFLSQAGSVPIPPYFQRTSEKGDAESYNNVYARFNGSVAAPTAGLHFTRALLHEIGSENSSYLTLHVGAGTFKPVLRENASDHDMHAESFIVSVRELKRIINILQQDIPLIVVGTTSCRTLESLYWCGVKLLLRHNIDHHDDHVDLELGQFEWKSLQSQSGNISSIQALQALVDYGSNGNDQDDDVIRGQTCLMIVPELYDFRVVHHLVTNFHAPDSTLMLLVAAFCGGGGGGDKIRELYNEAQERGYRFLSYGDVCLFSRPGYTLPVDRDDC